MNITPDPITLPELDVKPYKCDYCGQFYGVRACCDMRYDYLRHHGERILPPASTPPLNEPFGNPEELPLNEPSGDSGQLVSLEQRARELLAKQFEDIGYPNAAKELRDGTNVDEHRILAAALRAITAALSAQPPSEAVAEPGAIRALVTAANAVPALHPADDGMWTLEQAVRPFNAAKPGECENGCPDNQVCDYCQFAAPQPREVRGVDAGWIFYFTDDEGTPFVHFCGSRDALEQAVINHWFQGDDAEADDGQRMAPGIADELACNGVFHAEDGSCFAKPVIRPPTTPQDAAEVEEIDPGSSNFRAGYDVAAGERNHLAALIKDPVCSRCGAKDATEAAEKCRPEDCGCPATEFPLSVLWKDPDETTPPPGVDVGKLRGLLAEAVTKVENDRTLWTPEWQAWKLDAEAAIDAAAPGVGND